MDLHFGAAHALAAAIRSRKLSPVELMESTLRRIEALEPTLNAFVVMRADEALAEARALADRIARGEDPGPLAGLPLAVKDEEALAGFPTTLGSIPFKDDVAAEDSPQVSRLKAAGAIVVGKTNLPEFGHTAYSSNRLFGTTRNPWDPARTPGGSSGGTAAAIAAGIVPLGTAADGGGSIRIPASYTGTFGIKPSYGRVPKGWARMLDFSDTIAWGPITRTVRDAALYLDAVVGPHPADPDSLPHPGFSYVDILDRPPGRLRVGFSPNMGLTVVESQVRREVEAAVRAFADFGCTVEEIREPFPDVTVAWITLFAAEMYAKVAPIYEAHREDWDPSFMQTIELGRHTTAQALGDIQRARAEFNRFVAGIFERYDLLLTPTLPTVAFAAEGPLPREIDGKEANPICFTYPFNFTGHPAASVRAGLTDAGLPCGLQIVAPRHREDLLLQVAQAYEAVRPWGDCWPRQIQTITR
jgi:Asp-tRNA(Asn)/Glu-tRNA(Gln) amidotransferase A subunit family amidase